MITDSATTVAFTGHRTYDGAADARLRVEIAALYERGYRLFLSGMAQGFDLAAAEAVLACRAVLPGLRLGCVVPFEGQERRFSLVDRARYEQILSAADEKRTICPAYSRMSYLQRNDFLVNNASVLVAFYDGSTGGTRYTVRLARKQGVETINLYEDPQQIIPGLF